MSCCEYESRLWNQSLVSGHGGTEDGGAIGLVVATMFIAKTIAQKAITEGKPTEEFSIPVIRTFDDTGLPHDQEKAQIIENASNSAEKYLMTNVLKNCLTWAYRSGMCSIPIIGLSTIVSQFVP